MTTWLEICKHGAESRLPAGVPHTMETLTTAFIHGTRAQQKLQQASRSARREWSFSSSSLDGDGKIIKDDEVGTILLVEFVPTGSLRSAGRKVTPMPFMGFRDRVQTATAGGIVSPDMIGLTYADYNRRLYFHPASLDGTFYVTHTAKLLPYNPAAGALSTGRYANAAADIEGWLGDNGPEPEFEDFAEAMSAYVAMQTLLDRPELLQAYKIKYYELRAEWQAATPQAVVNNVPQDVRVVHRGNRGPVR